MIEHYSHKIQNAIQKELFKANKSIKIAVAWFTNDLLFQPLLLKLSAGVTVEIILNKDEINSSDENEIDFDEFVNAGGTLRRNDTKQLLHDKFYIIDDRIVIYGSYNWTNKAEYNEESIAIAKDEENTINFYLDNFSNLSQKYSKEEATKGGSTLVVREDKENTVNKKSPSDSKSSKEEDLYYTDSFGAIYSKDFRILYKGADIKEFKIDERTREIKENSFLGFNNLEKIELCNLERIGDNAFKDCKSLKSIKMPCVEVIKSYAFANCTSLCELYLPNNIKYIHNYAFSGCISLTDVNIPDNVSRLDWSVFEGCRSLKEISISESTIVTYDDFTQCYLAIKKHLRRRIMIPTSSSKFNEDYMKKGGSLMTLAEKNEADANNSQNKSLEFSKPNEFIEDFFHLFSFNDGEIITIPDNYKLFRRKSSEWNSWNRGWVYHECNYINAINSVGNIIEFCPSVFLTVCFEVDKNGHHIRENGRMKVSRATGTVVDFLQRGNFKNVYEGLKELTGCLIKVSLLKRVLVRDIGVQESVATIKDVMTRDVYDFSFIGERRPIGFVEKNDKT